MMTHRDAKRVGCAALGGRHRLVRAVGAGLVLCVTPSPLVHCAAAQVRWREMSGLGRDIAVGPGGQVWVIGVDQVPGGWGVYRLTRQGWEAAGGAGVRIAVDSAGTVWVVNDQGDIFTRMADEWRLLPGKAHDVGAGRTGQAWVIGTDRQPGGYGIWRWTGATWEAVPGGAVRIAVDGAGTPWVVNDVGDIYVRAEGAWKQLPGKARDIGVGRAGAAWVIGTDERPGGYGIWRWTGAAWEPVEGGGTGIAVSPEGEPWVVNRESMIYRGLVAQQARD